MVHPTIPPNVESVELGKTLESIYFDILKEPIHTIEANYEEKDLTDVDESYNIHYMRKYIGAHPSQSTIELADIRDNMHILDCGSGTGRVAIFLCKKFPNIHVDCVVNSTKLFHNTRENIQQHNLQHRIRVFHMDFEKLEEPIQSTLYDRILFLESFAYCVRPVELLDSMYERLKMDGKLFIKTPHFHNIHPKKDLELCRSVMSLWRYNFATKDIFLERIKQSRFGQHEIRYFDIGIVTSGLFFCDPIDGLRFMKFMWNNNSIDKKNNSMVLLKNIMTGGCYLLSKHE